MRNNLRCQALSNRSVYENQECDDITVRWISTSKLVITETRFALMIEYSTTQNEKIIRWRKSWFLRKILIHLEFILIVMNMRNIHSVTFMWHCSEWYNLLLFGRKYMSHMVQTDPIKWLLWLRCFLIHCDCSKKCGVFTS